MLNNGAQIPFPTMPSSIGRCSLIAQVRQNNAPSLKSEGLGEISRISSVEQHHRISARYLPHFNGWFSFTRVRHYVKGGSYSHVTLGRDFFSSTLSKNIYREGFLGWDLHTPCRRFFPVRASERRPIRRQAKGRPPALKKRRRCDFKLQVYKFHSGTERVWNPRHLSENMNRKHAGFFTFSQH